MSVKATGAILLNASFEGYTTPLGKDWRRVTGEIAVDGELIAVKFYCSPSKLESMKGTVVTVNYDDSLQYATEFAGSKLNTLESYSN